MRSVIQLRPHQERAVHLMQQHRKGQIIVPTGGGKTLKMIRDAQLQFHCGYSEQTIVVVAPRILLAEQLSSEFLEFITDRKSVV